MDSITRNIIAALVLSGLLVGGYIRLASYHFDRGYAAHVAELNQAIADANDRLETLNATLANEREAENRARINAVAEAIEATQGYCADHPDACGIAVSAPGPPAARPVCSATCGTPASLRAKLNAIQ